MASQGVHSWETASDVELGLELSLQCGKQAFQAEGMLAPKDTMGYIEHVALQKCLEI